MINLGTWLTRFSVLHFNSSSLSPSKRLGLSLADLPVNLTHTESSVRDWLHDLFSESDDRLRGFYSLDPGRRGKLLSSKVASASASASDQIRFAGISIFKTLPTFLFFCVIMSAIMTSKRGRRLYWQSWLLGSPAFAAAAALIYWKTEFRGFLFVLFRF